jgi:hypothetical protein
LNVKAKSRHFSQNVGFLNFFDVALTLNFDPKFVALTPNFDPKFDVALTPN